jgi:hypothetical protein
MRRNAGGHAAPLGIHADAPAVVPAAAWRAGAGMRSTLERVLAIETLLTVALFSALALLRLRKPIGDPDLGWHLAAGRHILDTGTLPRVDVFSYVAEGRPWLLYSWLAEVLFAALERALGPGGLIVVAALLVTATFAVVLATCRAAGARHTVAVAATLFAAAVALPTWTVRPHLFSFLFTAIVGHVIVADRIATAAGREGAGRCRLWWLVPLMVLWANTHVFFVYGLLLLGLHVAAGGRRWFWADETRRIAWPSLACLAAIGGALLVNPYGHRLLLHFADLATEHTTFDMVHELQSPSIHAAHGKILVAFLFAVIVAVVYAPGRKDPGELAPVLIFAGLALAMARNMPFFAIAAAPVLARHADALWRSPPAARRLPPGSRRLALHACLLAGIVAVAVVGVQRSAVHPAARAVSRTKYPVDAVAYLETQPPLGRLFNHFNWGGYLIGRLYPRYQVSMDGRTGVYGEAHLRRYRATQYLTPDWRAFLEACDPQVILWPVDDPFVRAVELLPEWRRVYRDDVAVIFVRAADTSRPVAAPAPEPSEATGAAAR